MILSLLTSVKNSAQAKKNVEMNLSAGLCVCSSTSWQNHSISEFILWLNIPKWNWEQWAALLSWRFITSTGQCLTAIKIKSHREKKKKKINTSSFLHGSLQNSLFLSLFSLAADVAHLFLNALITRCSDELDNNYLSEVIVRLTSRVCINVGLMASFINTARAPLTPWQRGGEKN